MGNGPEGNEPTVDYVQQVLAEEKRELAELDAEIARALKKEKALAKNINLEFESRLTFGQRVADKVADFGGSWPFIGLFGLFLVLWIGINTVLLLVRPFDPYPFILLNLILSCLAAIQAPVIMMSQNRQEAKDRLRSEHDYEVNLKAELEVRELNWKIDRLLTRHWQRLLEIQRVQTELLEEVARNAPPKSAD